MSLAELCVKRGVFAVMLIAFLVVLGIFSFRDLGVDLFPRADPATVNINVRLPGATPEEMTTQVVLPLEEALSTISGLDELTSSATEGNARITCQFVLEREIPGGTIVRGDAELGVRTLGRLDAVSQFGDIIVKNVGGSPVRVSDLGRVEDGFAEPSSWNMLDGKQAVSLDVRRQSGTNTVRI